jgi:sensor histidine kinase YesM
LEVKAISPEGKESDMSYAIQFDIGFPIWKSWWFIMLMIFMGIVFISTIFNQRLKSIEKRNNLELEKSIIEQELRSSQLASLKVQMNPHFIFNALNSIQDFILSNDKKQANNYLSKFARLMRKTLDLSNERSNLLSDELEVIQLYLELEAVRFEENFEYLMSVDKEINANEISIPSMLIQPFVENAIKHGLLHKKGFKKLNICFKLSEDKNALVCEITDNGIGIEKSKMLNSENKINHRSFSTGATQKRLDLLNLGRKNIIALKFEDLSGIDDAEATGTKVVLEIPFKEF